MHLFQFLTPGRWELFNREKLSSFLSLGGAILQYTFDENKLNNYSLDKRQLKVCKTKFRVEGLTYTAAPFILDYRDHVLDCLLPCTAFTTIGPDRTGLIMLLDLFSVRSFCLSV